MVHNKCTTLRLNSSFSSFLCARRTRTQCNAILRKAMLEHTHTHRTVIIIIVIKWTYTRLITKNMHPPLSPSSFLACDMVRCLLLFYFISFFCFCFSFAFWIYQYVNVVRHTCAMPSPRFVCAYVYDQLSELAIKIIAVIAYNHLLSCNNYY